MRGNWRWASQAEWLGEARVKAWGAVFATFWIALAWLYLFPLQRSNGVDFVAFWAAGDMVVDGRSDAVYDPVLHGEVIRSVAPDIAGSLPWNSPPTLLFPTVIFGLLGFGISFFAFQVVGLAAYLVQVRSFIPTRAAIYASLAATPSLWNLGVGQVGFLYGAAAMWFFRKSEVLWVSALSLVVFSTRPQLFLLVPVVLVVRRSFASIIWGSILSGLFILASMAAFGSESWLDFIELSRTLSALSMNEGVADFNDFSSLFTLTRRIGIPTSGAWVLHALGAGAVLVVTVKRAARKATPLVALGPAILTGSLLLSPRVLTYDLQLGVCAGVMLAASGLKTGFLPWERIGLLVAAIIPFFGPFGLPGGLVALAIVWGLSIRRLKSGEPDSLRPEASADRLASVGPFISL